ncbi:hypothetical protein TPHA_0E01180 [Tetrapisispora phaffii CBS 4417]|uniref:RING-type E3 ubiquitin transferase n=1 Tax=Tetrapisispora phaffii (strain ATCC 24235 / CBS 4417 / NBRC 1672 / NRRL Y-8282 / UCD 70-5) TaxID=1071381 RepID=G8BTI4_TETPH|nr:hypothetical protein TPHA_0E01180 [Tetrapisispora phaffii CBS 4417]CCE63212.1 hypothetical protein TPHA_0E01180 [Tetrapisispora phaffii CBS 4417]
MTSDSDTEINTRFINNFAHWQPDADIQNCLNCNSRFTFVNRKHHCRCCGCIFCADCSNRFVNYQPNIVKVIKRWPNEKELAPYRTCIHCYRSLLSNKLLLTPNGEIFTTSRLQDDELGEDISTLDTGNNNEVENNEVSEQNIESEYSNNAILTTNDPVTNTEVNSSPTVGSNKNISTIREIETNDEDHCPICYYDLMNYENELDRTTHLDECIQNASKSQQHQNLGNNEDGNPLSFRNKYKNRMLVFRVRDNKTKKSSEDEDECPICFETMEPGEKIARLECLCVFHYTCIKSWMKKKIQKTKESQGKIPPNANFCPLHDAIY